MKKEICIRAFKLIPKNECRYMLESIFDGDKESEELSKSSNLVRFLEERYDNIEKWQENGLKEELIERLLDIVTGFSLEKLVELLENKSRKD